MADQESLRVLRANLSAARRALVDAAYQIEVRTSELTQAKRRHTGDDLVPFVERLAEAQTALTDARTAEASAIVALQLELAAWLPDGTTAEQELDRVESTSPIVLFPVRLETRFAGDILKVRVYPDEIFLNTHEPALTQEEYDAARHYYETLNELNNERELWRDMVARFGAERSAYVLRQMLPTFGEPGTSTPYWMSSSTCGGTIIGGGLAELTFPPDIQFRAKSWTRPGEAVLPDRWIFVTYRGRDRQVHVGRRILEPLAMTADPNSAGPESLSTLIDTTRGAYKIDDNMRWTVDFARAVDVGMGIEISGATGGFDRLIVVGVKTSMGAVATSRAVEQLLDAHHYTRGMALLRQGTPTNNTEGNPTPYPPRENAGAASYVIERQRAPLDREYAHHCLPRGTDGYALSLMLGVPSGTLANVDRAYETEMGRAHVMNRALWPGTLGYFMQHLMDPIFSGTAIGNARTYFENYVLARGPAPAFRIGGTPYGVLPITALNEWGERTFDDPDGLDPTMRLVEQAILEPMRKLIPVWLEASANVPRLKTTTGSADVDLAKLLSTYPSSREFRMRVGKGLVATANLALLMSWPLSPTLRRFRRQCQDTFGRIGHRDWFPPVGATTWNQDAWFLPLVTVAPALSETDALPGFNFITSLAGASARDLNAMTHAGADATNLLYVMLRHSTLAEYARIAGEQKLTRWVEFELFGVTGTAPVPVIPSMYQLDDEMLLKPLARSHLDALASLAPLPTAELERLFTETLDLVSHRLDAWVSAFAYRRLNYMRRAQERTELAPKGDILGGYGWLENVRPRPPTGVTPLPDGRVAETQRKTGGFIHTPSMSHATAAAVLRNANLNFRDESASAYAVDLSSRRVRLARELFEGIRNGQPLGALLGYRFERALHDLNPDVPGLDQLRFALRTRFPLVANKGGQDGTEPAEAIAARNVVDGNLLLAAYRDNQLAWGAAPLPAIGSAMYNAVVAELEKLEQAYDAAADLLTAEGVFQLVRGNMDAAVPTVSNLVEGQRFPDTIVSRSARGGTGIAHRVALVFASDLALPFADDWPEPTARAKAEPVLNAWLGQLIGDPTTIRASITYLDAEGTPIDPPVTVTFAELGIHPLDLFAIAEAAARSNQDSVLDHRLLDVVLNDPARQPSATPARFQIEYEVGGDRSFLQSLETLHAAVPVLKSARPLAPRDLLAPAESETLDPYATAGDAGAIALYRRGRLAAGGLDTARAALVAAEKTPSARRAALRGAAEYAPLSAFPNASASDEALATAVTAMRKELERRLALVPDPVAETRPAKDLVANAVKTLESVFGEGFLGLPAVEAPEPDELALSLGARTELLGGDELAPDRYLQQVMRSRDRLGKYRKLSLYSRARGLARPHVHVVQFPHVPSERWLGLPFTTPPEKGRAALLLLSQDGSLDPLTAWTGIVLDDWVEVIPNRTEETAFAVHYRSPRAEAPQAVLVAAPSRNAPQWSFQELIGSLEQTIGLMQIRAVTSEEHDLGQVFPATVLGSNTNIENTVSTIVQNAVRAVTEILNG